MSKSELDIDYDDSSSSSYNKEKTERFHKKHYNLMQQRLRGRTAKTFRLQKESSSSYKDHLDKSDDIYKHWEFIKDKESKTITKTIRPVSNIAKGSKAKRRHLKRKIKSRRIRKLNN